MSFWQIIIDQAVNHGNFSFFILAVNIFQCFIGIAAIVTAIVIHIRGKRKK